MKLEHAEEVADLLARNFKSNNPVWSSFDLDQNEIHNFFLVDIKKHLESQERTRKDTSPEVSLNMVDLPSLRFTSTKAKSSQLE